MGEKYDNELSYPPPSVLRKRRSPRNGVRVVFNGLNGIYRGIDDFYKGLYDTLDGISKEVQSKPERKSRRR